MYTEDIIVILVDSPTLRSYKFDVVFSSRFLLALNFHICTPSADLPRIKSHFHGAHYYQFLLRRFKIWLLLVSLTIFRLCHGFYLPGSYPHKYGVGDFLNVKVNSLTSIETEMPFGYYSLPFCQPKEGVKDSAENLGELLMGDRIENSPYRFKMYTNETDIFLCKTKPLSGFKALKLDKEENQNPRGSSPCLQQVDYKNVKYHNIDWNLNQYLRHCKWCIWMSCNQLNLDEQ
ncbi:unnamed protein product [Fraxinus pennsylvanica]|uniref:Transmembrane 9 superfamily member n=1 Tax=Fraxinus pennsylvanica TaxID=56036 RepID=A0AAD2DR37_9LAMI|nr:unnamed protein product [Fraxinus pennsylvanica]